MAPTYLQPAGEALGARGPRAWRRDRGEEEYQKNLYELSIYNGRIITARTAVVRPAGAVQPALHRRASLS